MNKRLSIENVLEYLLILLIMAFIAIVGNMLASDGIGFVESLPGMAILYGIAILGLILSDVVPVKIPAVVCISIIGLLLAIPVSPSSEIIIYYTDRISMLPLATPVLAYSGISMGKNWAEFRRLGWRGILVAACVMFGTFVCSALVAQGILSSQWVI